MNQTSIKVPAELFVLAESSSFEGVIDIPLLEAGPDDYRFDEPLSWSVEVSNTGEALLLEGKVTGRGTCACARCLEDVTHDFEGDIEGYFLLTLDDAHGGFDDDDEELGDDEFDVLPDDHIINLVPLIEAALRVDAPDMPLCKGDCAGLCPQCGANLNEGPCGCGPDPDIEAFEREANPFAALADLKFD